MVIIQMVRIEMSKEEKSKGKAAVDLMGSQVRLQAAHAVYVDLIGIVKLYIMLNIVSSHGRVADGYNLVKDLRLGGT